MGAKVVMGDLNPPPPKIESPDMTFVPLDVTSWEALSGLFEKAIELHGRIDHVFANAGIAPRVSLLEDKLDSNGKLQEPDYRVLDINLKSVMNTAVLALHYMRKQETGGSIVLTASASSFQQFQAVDYIPALHPLHHPIRINAIAPSWTDTGIVPGDVIRQLGCAVMEPGDVARAALHQMADGTRDAQLVYSVGLRGGGVAHREIDEGLRGAAGALCSDEAGGPSLEAVLAETVAVQAAEGYSKMTGKTGICFITANSGFSNGLPGLATAFADRSSILCITSSVPLRDQENNSLQGQIDQVLVSKQLTKFAHRVTSAEDLPRIVAHAIHISVSGAPGPVLLDVPIDVLFAPTATALSQFASTTKIPIFHSGKFTHLAPLYSNPSFAGPAALLGALTLSGQPPDTLLLLGARTGMYLGGQSGAIVPPTNCRIIHVDTDGSELGRTFPVAVGIVSDAAQALTALTATTTRAGGGITAPAPWLAAISGAAAAPSPHAHAPPTVAETGLLHPHHALTAVFAALPPSPIVVLDGGEAALWAGPAALAARPAALMSSTGYLGFLGNGFGYALGSGVAAPGALVVLVQGDGSAGFHFMELDTFARHGVRVLTVVVNNECWGMSANGQDIVYAGKTQARPQWDSLL
ncbi:putative short-chain dehydrogenase reductase sdr protein [Neofusicoccum parvum UCRNP2]|uniref:Putative short-chain dehydrogenase reductase sdr protein n=1 Tax=Botryosphaeria parva (strain UCR-NP2) TaxID=1287680 RepID=R1EVJ2_BOTPV|nr:putative short-chain dehydrogenase reductase sdr protein [Neofusicoccum parvum UCRNP2]